MSDKEKKDMKHSANDSGGGTNSQLEKAKSKEEIKKKNEPKLD
jgi:hypothetical protein